MYVDKCTQKSMVDITSTCAKKNRDSIIGYRCKRKPVLIEGSLGVKLPIYGKIKQSSPTAEKRSSRV